MKKLIMKIFGIKPIIKYVDKIVEVQILPTDVIEGDVTVKGSLTVNGCLYCKGEITAHKINNYK